MVDSLTSQQVLDIAKTTVNSISNCFLITVGESGNAHARILIRLEPEEDLTLWFGTSPDSRKVKEIRHNKSVTIAFQDDSEKAYVSLMGEIEIIEYSAEYRTYWVPAWKAYFPEGPEVGYVLLKFTPHQIEVLNIDRKVTPPPFGLKSAILIGGKGQWQLEGTAN